MNLFNLFSNWKDQRCRKQDATARAEWIVDFYRNSRARGACRVDDWLHQQLTVMMPEKVGQRIFDDFRTRRAHEHPRAEDFLRQ